MKKPIDKLNAKIEEIFKSLQKLTWKQAFLFAGIPAGIIYMLIQTYQEIAPYYDKVVERKNKDEILADDEKKYLYEWYKNHYTQDFAKANEILALSKKEIDDRYPHNPDPTIPLIYKLPKYLIQNPSDEYMAFIFFSCMRIHTRYFMFQYFIFETDNHTNYIVNPQEKEFLEDTFYSFQALMQANSPIGVAIGTSLYQILYTYLTLVEKNSNYCEIWGDLRDKLQIITHDINLLLANNTPNFDEESLDEITKSFAKDQKANKNLRTCQ